MSSQAADILTRLADGARKQSDSGTLYGDFVLNAKNLDNQLDCLSELRRAAVALILFEHPNDGLSLLLSQRAKGLRHHAAQVGFPGGRTEPEDSSFYATAVRETFEEIGLSLAPKDLISPLAPFASGSGFWVQPFTFYLPTLDFDQLTLDPAEVDSVFSVPCRYLINPDFSKLSHFIWNDTKRYFATFDTQPNILWGLSAGIVTGWLRSSRYPLNLETPDPGAPLALDQLDNIGPLLPTLEGTA